MSEPKPNLNPSPYEERFPFGCRVRVADEATLRRFAATWKYHHPLQEEQVKYAGMVTTVRTVSFYHGGEVLYQLRDTRDFVWYDACLEAAD